MSNLYEKKQSRLSRGEYWILEELAEWKVKIRSLALPNDNLELAFNKKGHGLSRHDLATTLMALYVDDLIYFEKNESLHLKVSRDEIEHEINTVHQAWKKKKNNPVKIMAKKINSGIFCGVTKKGGRYWESFSGANWHNYIAHHYDLVNDFEKHKIISANKKMLDMYIKSIEAYEIIIKGKIKKTIIKPWKATYWKKLEAGHKYELVAKSKSHDEIPAYGLLIPESYRNSWYRLRM